MLYRISSILTISAVYALHQNVRGKMFRMGTCKEKDNSKTSLTFKIFFHLVFFGPLLLPTLAPAAGGRTSLGG